jgi:hypothetical protein
MKPSHHHKGQERRKHHRFPVVEGLIEPIDLQIDIPKDGKHDKASNSTPKAQPAILTNLSAGGMSLLTFVEPPHAHVFDMKFELPGLNHVPVVGKVVRVHAKGETFNVGIQFIKIEKKQQQHINDMAVDHLDCETRISLNLPEACVPTCRFHWLCHKPQKSPHWRKS